jgi:hypothetical protein
MTYLEALKGKVDYPLTDNAFTLCLEDRGITSSGTYVKGESFDLAYADALMIVVTTADKKEGGYSISLTDKKTLEKLANGIYSKYGIVSSLKPTAKFVQRW